MNSQRETAGETITIELNPREQRLYDRLRMRVVKTRAGSRSGVRDLVLLLPDLTVLLMRLMRDPLRSRRTGEQSYWIERAPIDPEINSMTNQF